MDNWGYARVSTNADKQAAGFADQQAVLSANGVTVMFTEQASAGGERPVFDAMIERAISHAEDTGIAVAIHVTKMDRGFRDLEQALRTIKRTPRYNVFWVLHDISSAPINPKDPAQALLVSVLGAISQFEKDRFAERRTVGIAKAKKEGKYRGRVPTAQRQAPEIMRYLDKGYAVDEVVKLTGVSRASVYRIRKEAAARTEAVL